MELQAQVLECQVQMGRMELEIREECSSEMAERLTEMENAYGVQLEQVRSHIDFFLILCKSIAVEQDKSEKKLANLYLLLEQTRDSGYVFCNIGPLTFAERSKN